jgi:dihydropteroate synthase
MVKKNEPALKNFNMSAAPFWRVGETVYEFGKRTYLMGIINLTPDSFSMDGLSGKVNYIDLALEQAERMVAEGADFLDLGAESSRPGAEQVSAAEEEARLLPVLKELVKTAKVPISVDTYKPEVAEQALNLGAAIINDIWGLQSPEDQEGRMAKLVGESKAPLVMMHNKTEAIYSHLMLEIIDFQKRSIELALAAGASLEQLVVDPGVGFGKTYEDNLAVLRDLEQLKVLGRPILLGTSRKSVVGLTLDLPVEERLEGTIATAVWGASHGADILRVHDVRAHQRAIKMLDAIQR